MSGDKLEGRVMWFDPARGYGFIFSQGRPNTFLHAKQLDASGIGRNIENGTHVLFRLGPAPGTGKECAVDIEIVKAEAA